MTFAAWATAAPARPAVTGVTVITFVCLPSPSTTLSLGAKPSCREVEQEARRHVVAEATLVGIYQR